MKNQMYTLLVKELDKDVLFSLLFSIYIERIMTEAMNDVDEGVKVGGD